MKKERSLSFAQRMVKKMSSGRMDRPSCLLCDKESNILAAYAPNKEAIKEYVIYGFCQEHHKEYLVAEKEEGGIRRFTDLLLEKCNEGFFIVGHKESFTIETMPRFRK